MSRPMERFFIFKLLERNRAEQVISRSAGEPLTMTSSTRFTRLTAIDLGAGTTGIGIRGNSARSGIRTLAMGGIEIRHLDSSTH